MAALQALIDLPLIVEHWVDLPGSRGCAILMREDGRRLAAVLANLLKLQVQPVQAEDWGDVGAIGQRLELAGYSLRSEIDVEGFVRIRAEHAVLVGALADHLGQQTLSLF